jgi:hypothetical protein
MRDSSTVVSAHRFAHPQAGFLTLLPVVERHARVMFRGRPAADREEAIAEAVAAAFVSYVRLRARGRHPARDFPSAMAAYAVLHVQNGRHVGGPSSSVDVLSPATQRKHGFRVESLVSTRTSPARLDLDVRRQRELDAFDERLRDNTRTAVPEQAAFRIDFPAFLRGLSFRDRRLARFLALGHSATEAAARFRLSLGRVSQLRHRWRRDWLGSQGEGPGGQIPSWRQVLARPSGSLSVRQ